MTTRTRLSLTFIAILTAVAAAAQTPTEPPSSQHAILTATGKGVQIYICKQASPGPQWVFQAPEATLIDSSGAVIGTHAAGPVWKSNDGSAVKGDLLQKSASPDPDAIPWLLLKAASPTGSGLMAKVEFIRRSGTHGGNAPGTGCDAEHLAATVRVPYSATYTFYSAKP